MGDFVVDRKVPDEGVGLGTKQSHAHEAACAQIAEVTGAAGEVSPPQTPDVNIN